MKYAIATAGLFLLLGTTAGIQAGQEKGQEKGPDNHSQQAKPEQQHAQPKPQQGQAKPAQRTHDARPAQQQQTQPAARSQQQAKPERQQQTQSVKPVPQQHTQQAHSLDRAPQGDDGRTQTRVTQSQPVGENRNASAHGRISNAHYASSFGSGHSFHVSQGDYSHRRFQYGGYSFGFVDPWPIGWGYSDDVYVVYSGGGYYMYDRVHPGVRISINIF